MNTKLLAAAATGGVAVVGSGGYLIHASVSGWTSVEDEGGSYGDNTVGKKFGKYFLSSKTNKSWWKSTLYGTYATRAGGKFTPHTSVTKAYDDKDTQALNQVCKSVYEKQVSDEIFQEPSSTKLTDTEKFDIADIWKLCAPYPVLLYSSYDTQNTIGSQNQKLLPYEDAPSNAVFWEIRNQEFWSGAGDRSKTQLKNPT